MILRVDQQGPANGREISMQKVKFLAYSIAALALTLAVSGCATPP
jgi:hypothetical protein